MGGICEIPTFGGGGVYGHNAVIHQHNFVNPQDPEVHTQSIKSLWKQAKKKLCNQSGTSQELFSSYVKEVIWHENYCKSVNRPVFSSLVRLIAENYIV